MEKISVTIITLNEEKNIERCLESLRWADEIVVADSFSSDATVEICRRFTDRVFQEQWRGYGGQKNFCASKASHRWILNVDADEVVPPATAQAIRRLLAEPGAHAVYELPRKNHFGGRWVRYGGWYPDRIARLYDRDRAAFSDWPVHERLEGPGRPGRIDAPLLHYSYGGMEDYVARQNRYSTLFAEDRRARGWRAGGAHIYLRPLWAFVRTYFLRQGLREGFLGFFLSAGAAYYTYLKYAKTRWP
ncbi:MAG: glycosyltransferase family 2 protein [Nitrospinaceae bacterium]|jgi:glycosyltransferase involved in cell wall biosynthesis|nr:MAG: glycosyltransferase family 2 protein [Nitrospinaceae bacterium]